MKLSFRQKNAILAGLRLLQSTHKSPLFQVGQLEAIGEIETNCGKQKPLRDDELDRLCADLNLPRYQTIDFVVPERHVDSPTTAELKETLQNIHGARKR